MSSSAPSVQTLDSLIQHQDVARIVRIIRTLCQTLGPTLSDGKARLLHPSQIQLVRSDDGEDVIGEYKPLVLAGAEAAKDPAVDLLAAYAAPEVFAGRAEATASTVYHVAALAYHLLTGQAPFTGSSPAAIRIQVLLERPAQPHSLRSDLSPALSQVLLQALDKKPDARPKSLLALADALSQAAAEPASVVAAAAPGLRMAAQPAAAPAPAPLTPQSASGTRRPVTVIALLIAMAVLVISGALLLSLNQEDKVSFAPMQDARRAPGAALPAPPPAAAPADSARASRGALAPELPMPESELALPADREAKTAAPALKAERKQAISERTPEPAKPSVRRKSKPMKTSRDSDSDDLAMPPPPSPPPSEAAMPSPAPRPSRAAMSSEEGAAPEPVSPAATKSPTAPGSPATKSSATKSPAATSHRSLPAKKTVAKAKKDAVATTQIKGGKAPRTRNEGTDARTSTPTVSDAFGTSAPAAVPKPVLSGGESAKAPEPSIAERPSSDSSRPPRSKKKAGVVLLGIALLAAIGASGLLWMIRRDKQLALQSSLTQRAGSEADTLQTSKKDEAKSPRGAIDPFVVGQYTCFERLGEGGMGMVYKARHTELGREAAVKVLSPSAMIAPDAIELFEREAKLSSQINHPNSVFIYDHGNVGGALFYLVMEFIDGQSLDEIISPKGKSPRPLPIDRVLKLTKQICSVLDTAHAQGIVHRDLR